MLYKQLNISSLIDYLLSIDFQRKWEFSGSDPEITEIGDGNWNFVYRIKDQKARKSLILKQAVPYVRCAGESWPFTTDRLLFEVRAMREQRRHVPHLVPEIFYVDEEMRLMLVEDIGAHPVLRGSMLQGRIPKRLANDLSDFLAQVSFHTSDWGQNPEEKKKSIARFMNPAMCSITEDLIFTAPFEYRADPGYDISDHAELLASLRHDAGVKMAALAIKERFMNCPQALLHGDLHTGSVIASEARTFVFDPEFAFYGPIGFDVGLLLGNIWMNSISQAFWSVSQERVPKDSIAAACGLAENVWNGFQGKFDALWLAEGSTAYWNFEEGEGAFAAYRKDWLRTVLNDSFAVAGCEMIRRTVGLAKNSDIAGITDKKIRKDLESIVVEVGRWLLINAPAIARVEDVSASIKQRI
jgi:5-methylthioribose kinase